MSVLTVNLIGLIEGDEDEKQLLLESTEGQRIRMVYASMKFTRTGG